MCYVNSYKVREWNFGTNNIVVCIIKPCWQTRFFRDERCKAPGRQFNVVSIQPFNNPLRCCIAMERDVPVRSYPLLLGMRSFDFVTSSESKSFRVPTIIPSEKLDIMLARLKCRSQWLCRGGEDQFLIIPSQSFAIRSVLFTRCSQSSRQTTSR